MKTRQRTIRLFEFEEGVDSQECKDFIKEYMPLLQNHTLGFRGEISDDLYQFLQENNFNIAFLSRDISNKNIESSNISLAASPVSNEIGDSKLSQSHSPHTLWIRRVVRSGEEIYHNGDIVIESQVNSGARIVADGNLFLFGECKGYVEAQGEFIVCNKFFASAFLFQDKIVDKDILQKINQSKALLKIVFKVDDNVVVKDLV